jgi:hypothetical protein
VTFVAEFVVVSVNICSHQYNVCPAVGAEGVAVQLLRVAGFVNVPLTHVYVDVPLGNNVGGDVAHWYSHNLAVRVPLVPLLPALPAVPLAPEYDSAFAVDVDHVTALVAVVN